MIDFGGQAVVVTGAGRGMGRLYALELARRGASVVSNDIAAHIDEIAAPDPYTIPGSIVDEVLQVCQLLEIGV